MKTPGSFIEKILLWILTVFFAVFALIHFPSLRCIAALMAAALLVPIRQWQDTLDKFVKGNIKTIITLLLVILTFMNLPAPEIANPSIPLTTIGSVQSTAAETTQDTLTEATDLSVTSPTTEPTTEPCAVATTMPTTEPATESTAIPPTAPPTETTAQPTTKPATAPTTAPTTASTTTPPSEPATTVATEPPAEPTTAATTAPPSEPTTPPTTNPPAEPTTKATSSPAEGTEQNYVLNKNSKKFHYPDCSSAKQIKDSNRAEYHGTRDDVLAMGYSPCGRCHP